MKVTRKGSVISTLDAVWLELTTFYYKQGLSLIDSFVCWETSKGKFYIMICWYLKNLTCVRVGGNFASQVQWLKGQILLLRKKILIIAQFSLVQSPSHAQLCDPMNHSMPGLPVHHKLLEFTQPHARWVGDAIQPSHPLPSPSHAINLSQHQGLFKWVSSSHQSIGVWWPKYWSFSFNISPSNEHPGLVSFRMDWLDLLAVQGTLKSLLQHHNSKAAILQCSAFFTVQLSHPYMTTGKTIALTRWTFVAK